MSSSLLLILSAEIMMDSIIPSLSTDIQKNIRCDTNRYPTDQNLREHEVLVCYAHWHNAFIDSLSSLGCKTPLPVFVLRLNRGLGDSLGSMTVCFKEALQMRLPFFIDLDKDWNGAIKLPFKMLWKNWQHLYKCIDTNPIICRCIDEYNIEYHSPTSKVKKYCENRKKGNVLLHDDFNHAVMHFMYDPLPSLVNELISLRLQWIKHTLVAIHIRTRFLESADVRNFFVCFQKYKLIDPLAIGILVTDSPQLSNFIQGKHKEGLLDVIVPDKDPELIGHSIYGSSTNINKSFKDFFLITIADTAILTEISTFSNQAAIYGGLKRSESLGHGLALYLNGNRWANVRGQLPKYCDVELGFVWPFKQNELFHVHEPVR